MNEFRIVCGLGFLLAACSGETRPAASPSTQPEQQNPVPPAGPAPAAPSPNSEPNMPSPESQPPDKAPGPSSQLDDARVNAGNLSAAPGVRISPEDADLLLVSSDRLEDFRLSAELRRVLAGDARLSQAARHVTIYAVDGEVTLRGVVPTLAERMAIVRAAQSIAGDEHVSAWIEIKR